jgi:hypothetical protein
MEASFTIDYLTARRAAAPIVASALNPAINMTPRRVSNAVSVCPSHCGALVIPVLPPAWSGITELHLVVALPWVSVVLPAFGCVLPVRATATVSVDHGITAAATCVNVHRHGGRAPSDPCMHGAGGRLGRCPPLRFSVDAAREV